MNAPFYPAGAFGFGASLWLALLIGVGFGFFLERAGLGSSIKLAGQFYLRDLTVFKVMFTAIATAAVGLYLLSLAGALDLTRLQLPSTFLASQVVGGLVFGVGFVVGGYCPGTGCVGLAGGRLDALVLLLGMSAGVFAFGELFPTLRGFYNADPAGPLTLDVALHLPYGVVVALVAALAVAGAVVAERIEARRRS